MDVDPPKNKGLFAQCSFVIVRSATLPTESAMQLASELRLHNGEAIFDDYPENSLDINGVTHIVSDTFDFPDYHACFDAFIPVIKPTWVLHSLAKNRLLNPRQYSPDPRYFMSDVVACVADLPEGDSDAIAGGILAMGGLFSTKLTNQVTHIIALTIESESCIRARERNLPVKIVLPHWVDDCLKLGRKIDDQPYLLPDPDILKPSNNKAPAAKRKTQVEGAVHPDPSQDDPQAITAPRQLKKVFKKKTVMLWKDLRISPYLQNILEGIITTSGGQMTDNVLKADMFICKYRSDEEYRIASRAGKDVGNLAWLYYLIQTDEWTSPTRRLLHYPLPKDGLPGFEGLKISLSNYSGDARTYLENLINATGAECTKTLKQDNTHLITAHVLSEKCAAAKDWGIHIINHLWLEESYTQWKMQSITDNRYTHFPKRTNLGEVVGHTQLDRTVLEKCFFPQEDVEMTDAADTRPMQQVNNNAVSAKKSSRTHEPEEATHDRNEKLRTPAPSRLIATGKENITPSTTHSRKSKDVASARLHEMTPDMMLYEKERKRVGGVIYGGRRKTDEDRIELGRKRSVDEASDEMTVEIEAKKVKRGSSSPAMHLVVSGYEKWVGHAKIEDNDKKQLRNLGITCTTEPSRATHLAAPRIVRTMKFVTALAYAPMVISTDYIDACLEANEQLDPKEFRLQDKENEQKLGVSLKLSRERAQKNQGQLLQGRIIYCLENIRGGFDTFKAIVGANGGECRTWRGRKGTTVPSGRADSEASTDTDANNEVYLLSNDDDRKENKSLWTRFKEMAEGSRKVPRIVTADWLLETAMSQLLLPTKQYELAA
ncbi:regulator of Ty1 Transposition [Exophiala xenobiotica]|uniref:Regulator of Ty1 Transposition n=1 Tax=Vermiconidia calcicola TaxID=1690605 RepID=A0AAV9QD71_9PEZI|nr:regulator of Ty1 Transposition [Exophiala xenobiotica]KAK5539018.1 regulator of Ty1 Transposition [Vermiconidia calcicola]KAK5547240.1 regulator of Ty1 Transposition [Chaetothyriales sp. CCFEE 6169]KAK5217959.1 regulator of Ty1 Transposition [Exophiala xenobiotica]KAK5227782.1 regulator of Ty1 Transposition [Exophiala xenobiotica]